MENMTIRFAMARSLLLLLPALRRKFAGKILALFLIIFSPFTLADQEHKQLAIKFEELQQSFITDDEFSEWLEMISYSWQQSFSKDKIKTKRSDMEALVKQIWHSDEHRLVYAKRYIREFDKDELKQLIEIYENPVFRKFMAKKDVMQSRALITRQFWNAELEKAIATAKAGVN